jgi:hypothetical protein
MCKKEMKRKGEARGVESRGINGCVRSETKLYI